MTDRSVTTVDMGAAAEAEAFEYIIKPGLRAGYCGQDGAACGCPPTPDGSMRHWKHGQWSSETLHVLVARDAALVLVVNDGDYPFDGDSEAKPLASRAQLHLAFPAFDVPRERWNAKTAASAILSSRGECEWLDGRPCWGWDLGYGVDDAAFSHPEGIEAGLTELARVVLPKARAHRADRDWQRCPCCEGAGATRLPAVKMGSIAFIIGDPSTGPGWEVLRFEPDGSIYVYGEKTNRADDSIVDAVSAWCVAHHKAQLALSLDGAAE